MSTSFDNLVARKGSPTHSFRSGSTNASASNMSETRDLSRQSAQQQRINHRRAIQARKVVFLVLILLLILGGLSYAIYRVVSNDSEEAESTKIKLEENDETSANIKTSSVATKEVKTSISPETTKTLIFSKKREQRYSTNHVTSTISTLKQAPEPDHKTSSISKAHETPSLQSTMEHTSSYIAVQNAPSSSAVFSVASQVDMTKISRYNIANSTSNVVPTSIVDQHSSYDNIMTSASIIFPSVPLSNSANSQRFDQNPSSTIVVIKPSTASAFKESNVEQNPPSTETPHQAPSSTIVIDKFSTSVSSSSFLQISNFMQNLLTTNIPEQTPSSSIAIDSTSSALHSQKTVDSLVSSQSTNTLHSQSSSIENIGTLSSFPSIFFDNIILTSPSTIPSEIGQILSSVTPILISSGFAGENAPKMTNSTIVKTMSTSVLPSISSTRAVAIPSNTSHTNNITTLIPVHPATSVVVPTMSGSAINSSIDAGDMATATIQPTKTFVTPVVSSSVWVPPYYHPWSNWSICSRDCGGGYMYQTRNCFQHGQCDHLGPSINTTICNFHKCNETTFHVSLNLTDVEWTDDFHNTSSQAYTDLVEQLMGQLRALYGPNVSIEIDNISQGSVIISLTITFSSSNYINSLMISIKIGNLSVVLLKIVNNMVPKEPDFILVQNTTTNSTIIHWSSIQPNETNGILLGYTVMLTPGNVTWTLNDEEATSQNVVNLIPDTEYTISVLGFNINGDGEIKSATFKTKELPPHFLPWGDWNNCSRECGGGVTSRNRSCTKEDMCSHLGKYEQKEYCNVEKCNETSYEVGLNMTNVDWTDDLQNTSSAAYQELLAKFLEELRKKYPNATIDIGTITKGSVIFSFKITFPKDTETDAESLSDDFEDHGLGNFTTDVNKLENTNLPRVSPGSIKVTMVTHHSTVINWLPISDEDSNGAIIGYKIVLVPGYNITMEFNLTARASDIEFSYVLQMLAPNTTYQFYVYGYNINGDGPESELFNFTTKVQIPKIVSAYISDITTTHALISWQRINDNNETYGIITGYKIFIKHNHQPRLDLEVSSFEEEVHLDNLLPNTSYGVNVFGYNHYGDGVISDMFNFTTKVQIPELSSANISHITRSSGMFSWNKIPDNEESYGNISGYKIIIICENHGSRNMTVSQNESSIELRDLHSGTSYNITIVGFNTYGEGLVSDIFGFRTRDMIPKPNPVAVTNITLTTAKLSWGFISSNEKTYGNIDGYMIIIRRGSLVNTTIVRDIASIVLRNISSNSTYCFNVVAFNTFGDGLQSDMKCFTTLVEEEIDELKTSVVVILKPSQSKTSTAHASRTRPEKLMSTRMEEMKKSSSVLTDSSVLQTKANSAKISATSTAGGMFMSMISYSIHQETPVSSYSPSSSFNPSSQILTYTKATSTVFTAIVQPSSTMKAIITRPPVPTTTSRPESSSDPTESSTPKTSLPTRASTESEPTPSQAPDVKYIVGKIRLKSETFNSELNDPESETYKTLASKLEKTLEDLFRADGLQLESVEVLGFSQGSVVFDFYVKTLKSMEYQSGNFSVVLLQAITSGGGLEGQPFDFSPNDFSTMQVKPSMPPTRANEANKGLQKNEEEDDSALIVAVVICVLLVLGVALVVFHIGKKKNWFKRGKRKVVPEDDDDDDDDDYPSPANDTVRLKTAHGGRRSHGARINGGHSTTEC